MNKKQLQSFLRNAGHSEMMQIQQDAVDTICDVDNVILYSKTGSGKTLAFLFAILAKMENDSDELEAIILAPSRELTIQIEEVFRSLKTGKKITVCYGGHSVKTEENSLSQSPNIVVGTPGRIVDHIHRRNLDLRTCPMLVIDEFDKCLEFGFSEEMGFIAERMRALQQRMLVSATKMDEIPEYLEAKYHVIDALKENDEIAVTEHLVHSGKNIVGTLATLLESFENEKDPIGSTGVT